MLNYRYFTLTGQVQRFFKIKKRKNKKKVKNAFLWKQNVYKLCLQLWYQQCFILQVQHMISYITLTLVHSQTH